MNEATRPASVADAASRPSRGKGASIAREVASLIVSGELVPGTLLPTEHALVRRHGASRPVIREAIRRLSSAGLVETRHGVGSLVTPPRLWKVFDPIVLNAHLDNRDLPAIAAELLDLRRMVEVESAGIAAARIAPQPLADLAACLDRMGACLDDAERAARADFAFHEAIIEATGNRFFAAIVRYVREALWESRLMTSRGGGLAGRTRAFEFHRRIYRAIAEGDAATARAVMAAHLDVAADDLRRVVLASGNARADDADPQPVSANDADPQPVSADDA